MYVITTTATALNYTIAGNLIFLCLRILLSEVPWQGQMSTTKKPKPHSTVTGYINVIELQILKYKKKKNQISKQAKQEWVTSSPPACIFPCKQPVIS